MTTLSQDHRKSQSIIAKVDDDYFKNKSICWETISTEMLSKREMKFIIKTCASCECCSRHKENLFSGTNTDQTSLCSSVPDLVIKKINRDGSPPGDGCNHNCDCRCRHNFRYIVRIYSQMFLSDYN